MMEVGDQRSSSLDLSSAPSSDTERPRFDFSGALNNLTSSSLTSDTHKLGDAHRNIAGGGSTTSNRQDPPKQKRAPARKLKDPSVSASDASKPKIPKKRAAPGTATTSKRKTKSEATENQPSIQNIPPATTLQSSRLVEPYSFSQNANPYPREDEAAKYSQNGFLKQDPAMQAPTHPPPSYSSNYAQPSQPQPNPSRSTAAYDPVRSITTPRPPEPPQANLTPQSLSTPPRPTSKSGASPLSNLIDGPMPTYPTAPSPLRTFVLPADSQLHSSRPIDPTSAPQTSGPMDLDAVCHDGIASRKPSVTKELSSEGPTRATSPKPARAKEKPPPMPAGSGLLSASLFGGEIGVDTGKDSGATGPNIVLHIDLKDPHNKVINFARLAEEKYGFDALYPRQAAQRKRLSEIAARGAALERSASGSKVNSAGESGDEEGSVDIDRDSDNDGDVNMSGVNGIDQANSGTDGPELKRKRRKKVEDYDQEDPFIDDSEQLWEQQAAASKDGFFVYCGPLVPEGEKPAVERADGTVKRGGRGRGRGGGPGSRGGRGARAAAAAAAAAAARDAATPDGEARPAHGPGSRGGVLRGKPRGKKSDRPQLEQDRAAREKSALLPAKPEAYPTATAVVATTAI